MPGQRFTGTGATYLTIVGGNLVQKVAEGTEGARLRKYEKSDKSFGEKWEIVYTNWEALITGIEFKKGDYGDECKIIMADAILTLPTAGRYFADFAAKLKSADVSKPLLIHPYSFEVDGKMKTGVSLQQDGVKLQSYYWDSEAKKSINGIPQWDKVKADKSSSYAKVYFAELEAFLVDELSKIQFVKVNDSTGEVMDQLEESGLLPWEEEANLQ